MTSITGKTPPEDLLHKLLQTVCITYGLWINIEFRNLINWIIKCAARRLCVCDLILKRKTTKKLKQQSAVVSDGVRVGQCGQNQISTDSQCVRERLYNTFLNQSTWIIRHIRRGPHMIFKYNTGSVQYIDFISPPVDVLISFTFHYHRPLHPLLTLSHPATSSFLLGLHTIFSPFHPVEPSSVFALGLISARLLPVLALSLRLFHPFPLYLTIFPTLDLIPPPPSFHSLSGYLPSKQERSWEMGTVIGRG